MKKYSAVIVDVDGTLAEFDPEEVRHWVLGEEKHWDAFFDHMETAAPIDAVVKLVRILHQQGQKILICSGRPETHMARTLAWLNAHEIPYDGVYLRKERDDHLRDEVVKAELLEDMKVAGFEPWLVLDDRDAVVAQWRALGLTCLQCAEGDF
ncbi:phosphatase domain-containing protein [Nitrincola alkalisediminis]|nr:HAD family acid phosphatase [Nitrincola alkalisediminis]